MGEVQKQGKVKALKSRKITRRVGNLEEKRGPEGEGWRSLSTGRRNLCIGGGRGTERLGKHETQDRKHNRSPECQGYTEQRRGDLLKPRSSDQEEILTNTVSLPN